MVISSQRFDPLKRDSNATKGTNSRLGWTKYSDLHEIVHSSLLRPCVIRELKQLPRRQRQRQKTIGFMSKTTVLHVHQALSYIALTSTAPLRRETSQHNVLWRAWTYNEKLSSLYLTMDKFVKNSTPRKLAYIWRIAWFQINAIKFERTQIHLFSDVFTGVVVVVTWDPCVCSVERNAGKVYPRFKQNLILVSLPLGKTEDFASTTR